MYTYGCLPVLAVGQRGRSRLCQAGVVERSTRKGEMQGGQEGLPWRNLRMGCGARGFICTQREMKTGTSGGLAN